MYTFDSRVRYSELAENGCLSLDAMVNYMQDCVTFEAETLDVGMQRMEQKNRTWVLAFWQIVIDRYPRLGELMHIGTQAYGFDKMFGYRNFLLTDQQEQCMVKANSIWVLLDSAKGRPVFVTPEEAEIYGQAEPLEMEYAPRKIKIPKEGGQVQEKIRIQEFHLDTNHHVNNAQYVRLASSFVPTDRAVHELRVEYRTQAVLGDEVIPEAYYSDTQCLIALKNEKGGVYAVVQFIYA